MHVSSLRGVPGPREIRNRDAWMRLREDGAHDVAVSAALVHIDALEHIHVDVLPPEVSHVHVASLPGWVLPLPPPRIAWQVLPPYYGILLHGQTQTVLYSDPADTDARDHPGLRMRPGDRHNVLICVLVEGGTYVWRAKLGVKINGVTHDVHLPPTEAHGMTTGSDGLPTAAWVDGEWVPRQ